MRIEIKVLPDEEMEVDKYEEDEEGEVRGREHCSAEVVQH